ncbi:MAG: ABC transporter substrate-binding protein [bacterium]
MRAAQAPRAWRRFFSLFHGWLAALVALALAGCGGQERPLTDLQYWNGFVGPDGNITEPILKDFESKTGARIEVQKMPWGIYFDKLISAIAAGNPPDVFVLHMSELASYAEMGALLPLDEYINSNDSFCPKADRIQSIWERACYKGQCYGVPLDIHLLGLYYNKDYFDAAHLPYPSVTEPLRGEQFIEIARKLTIQDKDAPTSNIWGFSFSGEPFRNFDTLLWQFGGNLLTDNLKQSAINSPEANKALQWMHDLVYKHKVSPMPEGVDTWQFFVQGRIAMITEGCWVLNGLTRYAKFRWGVAPFFLAGGTRAVWATGHVLCLSRNLPRERIPMALKLMKHLNDTGVMWSTSGMLPTRYSQIRSKEFLEQSRAIPFTSQLDRIRFEPASPIGIELRDRYQQTVFSCLAGLFPVQQALARVDGQMNRTIETYYR